MGYTGILKMNIIKRDVAKHETRNKVRIIVKPTEERGTRGWEPQSNACYRAPTELVQHSAYRGNSHCRNVASSHICNMMWLYRSPVAVGSKGVFYLIQLLWASLENL